MLTNANNIPVSLAVWLANDNYDYNDDPNTFSATTIQKSVKQIILSSRVDTVNNVVDINSRINSRIGTAIHNDIENSWKDNYVEALRSLGYPANLIKNIIINPSSEDLENNPDAIPIYLENREERTIEGVTITGKYDLIVEGQLHDYKSTSTYTYQNKTNDKKYILQGSIYRWLNQNIVTNDVLVIQFIFLDWKANMCTPSNNYPANKVLPYNLPLMSITETETYLRQKIQALKQYKNNPEEDMPDCTPEDLWQSLPTYKYYKNASKTNRSTKNFDNMHDAQMRLAEDGYVGVVIEKPGSVTACKYCDAFSICKQKDTLIQNGLLTL